MEEKFKCPHCGYEQWKYPNVHICIECGGDLNEPIEHAALGKKTNVPGVDGSTAKKGKRTRIVVFLIGIASGIAVVAVWNVVLDVVGDLGRIIAAVLASGVAAGMSAYYRESAYERFIPIVVLTLFAALLVDAVVAKAYIVYFMGGEKPDFYSFFGDNYIAFSSLDIFLGAVIGTVFGKQSRQSML
jgi:hypothetical protein